ncbi:MAG: hypothetical protein CM15mP58_13750 [Burkholderiaceae bacterium]|nr:MAG: hypothetical protein CM15mP58_13750 [Burkholderiaceae bacterium]
MTWENFPTVKKPAKKTLFIFIKFFLYIKVPGAKIDLRENCVRVREKKSVNCLAVFYSAFEKFSQWEKRLGFFLYLLF